MWISSLNVKNLILIFLSTQLLLACNLPSPQDRPASDSTKTSENTASFYAKAQADKSKVLESSVKGAFGFPFEKVYNFQVCLKDAGRNEIIAGHDFTIVELNKEVTTDKDGCANWPEKFEYAFLADSKYLKIERTIAAKGLHKGQRTVSFAINPWSHGENLTPVLDPETNNNIPGFIEDDKLVEKALKGFNSKGEKITRPLWVDDGRLFVTEQKMTNQGIELLVEMRPNVTLLLKKMNGELFSRPLNAGKFKANLQIVHVYQHNNQEARRILATSEEIQTQMQSGSLAIRSALLLKAIPTRGQMLLTLHLAPVEGPAELGFFEGLYLLGEYDQVKGASFLRLHSTAAQTQNFRISDYVNSSSAPQKVDAKGVVDEDAYQKPKVEVSQLQFQYIRVGEERTTTREVVFNIKACLKNGLDQKVIRSHSFKITRFRESDRQQPVFKVDKTDNNACLNWDEKISFKYFDCQHYIPGFIEIENQDLGMKEKLEVIVNPWESSGGAIARDVRYVDETEMIQKDCKVENRPRTQLIVDSFSYNALSYSYSIDALLGLKITKKLQMRIDPRVLIYSSLSNGRSESQRLRDGVYLLRTVVVQNRDYSKDLNNYITSAETLVNVMNGQINTEISFSTEDLKALGNRNNLLLEIFPVIDEKVTVQGNEIKPVQGQTIESVIDRKTGLESPVYVGPIILNQDDANRPVKILSTENMSRYLLSGKGEVNSSSQISLSKIIADGKSKIAKIKTELAKKALKQNFANDNNLHLISLAGLQNRTLQQGLQLNSQTREEFFIQRQELQDFASTGKLSSVLAQKLCIFWSQDYLKTILPGKNILVELTPNFGLECVQAVRRDPSLFFNWDQRLLVKEIAETNFVHGLNQGLNVGTSFGLSYAQSQSFTKSFSVSSKSGLSLKFLNVMSVGLDAGYSLNRSNATSNSASNGMSVNGNTSLSLQENKFRLKLKKYEQCVVVKLNPLLFAPTQKSGWFQKSYDYSGLINQQIPELQMASALTRGLMLCEGVDRTRVKTLEESYYLISQETYTNQMQDSGDARNRQFFIGLRSDEDLQSFVLATKSQITLPNGAQAAEASSETSKPLLHLMQNIAPQAPGMIRVPGQ